MKLRRHVFVVLLIPLAAMMGCTGDTGPTGPQGAAGTTGCADCHNDTNLISGKMNQWSESVHGTGEAYLRGTSTDCVRCHSGTGFARGVAAGVPPDQMTEGDADPTRQDCRACHKIHDSYTKADFALRTTAPVQLFAVAGATFDGGKGNLCVNCHQPRRDAPVAVAGMVTGISTHWGPHHGPQSAMLMGRAGAGVAGSPGPHYLVQDTCVHCHMGDGDDHTFEPATNRCTSCHGTLTSFDYHNVQTDVQALLDQLGTLLVGANVLSDITADGHPTVTQAPENQALALWNWLYVAHEDKSRGVHNPEYTKALLNYSINLMQTP